jgi:hypothetical protein
VQNKYVYIEVSYSGVEVIADNRDISQLRDMDISIDKSSVILCRTSSGLIPMMEELDHLCSTQRVKDYCNLLRAYIKIMDCCNSSKCKALRF